MKIAIFYGNVKLPEGKSVSQWPGTDSLEVPTIYIYIYKRDVFFNAMFQGISLLNLAEVMVLTYLNVRIMKFPLNKLFTVTNASLCYSH